MAGAVVWVLGSGFSRHVGGPTLDELLSEKMGSLARARHPSNHELYAQTRQLFRAHHKDNTKQTSHRLWANAEDFLDYVDLARKDYGLAKVAGTDSDSEKHWRDAVNAVVEECSFANTANLELEAWSPYKVWKDSLTPEDSVITFNYDLVTEQLGLTSILPSEKVNSRTVKVFKLHGSLDWYLTDDVVKRDRPVSELPFIATPGPTKLKSTNEKGPLAVLWNRAKFELGNANAIVFMGYRFPPSDSYALMNILGAFRENKDDGVLTVHTVLGPRIHDEHSLRLTRLLDQGLRASGRKAMGTGEQRSGALMAMRVAAHAPMMKKAYYEIHQHPLYAQDFMALVPRTDLIFSQG
jgi:hypothetical protein